MLLLRPALKFIFNFHWGDSNPLWDNCDNKLSLWKGEKGKCLLRKSCILIFPQKKCFSLSLGIFPWCYKGMKISHRDHLMGHSDLKSDWSWKYAFQYLLSALNSKDLQMNSKKFSPRGHSYLITFQLRGHSCKIGNVRYGGTSKTPP